MTVSRRGLISGSAGMGLMRAQPAPLNAPGRPPFPAAVTPGARQIVRARSVIVSGTGAGVGVFIYNGTPGPGNPPQIAEVPAGATVDPFGNPLSSAKILMQGNAITEAAGIFRTSATAPLIQLDGPHDALLIYDAAANLVDTIAPVATTDGIGHTVYAGIINYSPAVNAIAQLLNGLLNVGTPAQIAGTGGATPGILGLAGAGNPGVVRIDSGLTATGDLDAFVDVRSSNAQAAISTVHQRNITLAGPLALSVEGSPPLALAVSTVYDNNGVPHTRLPGGSHGNLSSCPQTKLTSTTVAGATGALASFSIPAGELQAGSVYELICGGGGTFGNPAGIITLGAGLNGAVIGIANGPAAASMGAGQNIRWAAVARFIVQTAGASGSVVGWVEWQFTQIANNVLPGTAADNTIPGVAGAANGVAINTTVANTLSIVVNDSAGTGATMTALAAYLKKVA
jgi:hypothetical protein